MFNRVLLGAGRRMLPIPGIVWQSVIRKEAKGVRAGLAFMTENHHRVRDFVVLELSRRGAPLSPDLIAEALGLELEQTVSILDRLEKRMTFLFRNDAGEVTWAYPVTVDETPHRAHFSTGEDAFSP